MARNVLGLSWLNGRFSAVALQGGRLKASWSAPDTVPDEQAFGVALAEAMRATQFRRGPVVIVLDHRRLLFHLQETPPARGRLLESLIERAVSGNHFFEEKAVWSRLGLPETKERLRHLLALLPASLLEQLSRACAQHGLELAGVVPPASVLALTLRQLPTPPDEPVLLAADCGPGLSLLVGRRDGQMFFARAVIETGANRGERAVQEINRTLYFAQQQFGTAIQHVFAYGPEVTALLRDRPIRDGLKAEPLALEMDPLYFASAGARLSRKAALNLVSPAGLGHRQWRWVAAAAMFAMLATAITTPALIEPKIRARLRQVAEVQRRNQAEDETRTRIVARSREVQRLAASRYLIGLTNDPPVAELFTRYLATVLPPEMRLSGLAVEKAASGWSVRLDGFTRERGSRFLTLVEDFENALRRGDFKLEITDSTHQQTFKTGGVAPPVASPKSLAEQEQAFFITGQIL